MASIGLPVVFMAGGEGEKIVKQLELGWSLTPGAYQELSDLINSLSFDEIPNKQVIAERAAREFDFKGQFERFENWILAHDLYR